MAAMATSCGRLGGVGGRLSRTAGAAGVRLGVASGSPRLALNPGSQSAQIRLRGSPYKVCAIGGLFGGKEKPKRNDCDAGLDLEYEGPKAELDTTTSWRLSLTLGDNPKPVSLKVKFDLEEGYEPPQGVIEVLEDEAGLVADGTVNRWQLSEELERENPLDGGGLWVWGMFEEPLYPYLVFGIELGDGSKLFAQLPHARGSQRGAVLSEGTLCTQEGVSYNADLIGLSKALINEKRSAGQVRAVPIDRYV